MLYLNAPARLPDEKIKNLYKVQVPYHPRLGGAWYDMMLYTPECFARIKNIHDNIRNVFGKIDIELYDMERLVTRMDGATEFLMNLKNEICTFVYKNCHAKIPTIDRKHAYLMEGLCRWQDISDGMSENVIENDAIYLRGMWFKIVDGDVNNRQIDVAACDELYDICKERTNEFQRELENQHGLRIESLPKFLMSCGPPVGGMSDSLYDLCATCIDERVQHLKACIEIDSTKALVHHSLIQIARDIDQAIRPRETKRRRI